MAECRVSKTSKVSNRSAIPTMLGKTGGKVHPCSYVQATILPTHNPSWLLRSLMVLSFYNNKNCDISVKLVIN